jgi:colanic acid biosynthesis glycosyl transferase WcaI
MQHCETGDGGQAFRERWDLAGKYVVLYAGLMGYAQDMTLILDCARRCADRADWQFVLAGDGPRAAEVRVAAASAPNVRFVGCLPNEDYFEAIQAADVCLVPLIANLTVPAVPGKVPTIMASGKPFVASVPAGNDTRQLAVESGGGLAIDAGKVDQLVRALELLYNDPILRQKMGSEGWSFARQHLSVEQAVGRFESELTAVCHPEAQANSEDMVGSET